MGQGGETVCKGGVAARLFSIQTLVDVDGRCRGTTLSQAQGLYK